MLKKKYDYIKVLCIEDEDDIRQNQVDYLKRLFNHVYEANGLEQAVALLEKKEPHIVISDIKLPEGSGLEFIREHKHHFPQTKFIILSAYSHKEYLLDAIDLGLVKYLIKPIDHETLYPLLKKCVEEIEESNLIKIQLDNACFFDFNNCQLFINESIVDLSKYEADFLLLLYKNKNSVVPYEQIQNSVWQDNIMTDNSLRSLVKSLRRKIPFKCIENLSKVGYKLSLSV